MILSHALKRRIGFILLFFIFTPIFYQCEQNWVFSKIKTGNCRYNCGKITYPLTHPIIGLELAFTRGSFGMRGTVSIRCREIPPYQGKPKEAIATLFLQGQQIHFIAHRMEGGQELLLPEKITETMLDALKNNASFVLYLDGYEAQISPCNFGAVWKKFIRIPICLTETEGE